MPVQLWQSERHTQLHATKVFILADGTVQLVRPKCSFLGDIFRLDDTDMDLFCFGYFKNDIHSCGGTYGHCHIPILKAELADINSLTYSEKPLLELRKVLIGEYDFVDFIEMYSNNIKR
jgi:hypothetical protein